MRISLAALLGFLLLSVVTAAQEFDVPANLPKTKDEFVKSEPDFIAAAKWLESTAVGAQADKRKKMNAWALQWVMNSPTVTVEVMSSLMKPFDKNPELSLLSMIGYTRYCLENNYSTDKLKCNTAGIKAALNCYNLGGDVKKDKAITKLLEADKEGKLEDWVKEAMKEK